jgi:hypothetical protein
MLRFQKFLCRIFGKSVTFRTFVPASPNWVRVIHECDSRKVFDFNLQKSPLLFSFSKIPSNSQILATINRMGLIIRTLKEIEFYKRGSRVALIRFDISINPQSQMIAGRIR